MWDVNNFKFLFLNTISIETKIQKRLFLFHKKKHPQPPSNSPLVVKFTWAKLQPQLGNNAEDMSSLEINVTTQTRSFVLSLGLAKTSPSLHVSLSLSSGEPRGYERWIISMFSGYFWHIDSANLNLDYSTLGDREKSKSYRPVPVVIRPLNMI